MCSSDLEPPRVLFYRCTAKLNRWFDCVHWPWVQAIRSYVREREPELLSSEMGSGAADIAEIVSDVRERLPGLPQGSKLEPEQEIGRAHV